MVPEQTALWGHLNAALARAAAYRVTRLLEQLRKRPRRHLSKLTLTTQVQELIDAAAAAGSRLTPAQRSDVTWWRNRAGLAPDRPSGPAPLPTERTPAVPRTEPRYPSMVESIEVWVWADRDGRLHSDTKSRALATRRRVPLPVGEEPLPRLHANLTRMITGAGADGSVHHDRASLTIRVFKTSNGQVSATLTRRKNATVVQLPLATFACSLFESCRRRWWRRSGPTTSPHRLASRARLAITEQARCQGAQSPFSGQSAQDRLPQGGRHAGRRWLVAARRSRTAAVRRSGTGPG